MFHCVDRWLWVVGVAYKPSDDCCSGHETMVMEVHLRLAGRDR